MSKINFIWGREPFKISSNFCKAEFFCLFDDYLEEVCTVLFKFIHASFRAAFLNRRVVADLKRVMG
jgi:hypothetical protein